MRGRPTKPTALKVLHGNPGKRSLPKDEPRPDVGPRPPNPPSWLSREAKAEWRRVAPQLHLLGLLSRVDRAALAAYCETWAEFYAAQKDVKENGQILTRCSEAQGEVSYPNPAVRISADARKILRQYLTEFGLTPSSRVRLHVPGKKKPADPMGEFFG